MKKTIGIILSAILVLAVDNVDSTEKSAFVLWQFAGGVSIEVPADWKYQNPELNKHFDTAAEAMVRLADVQHSNAANDILIAGYATTTYKTNSAYFRLSIRPSGHITQAAMSGLSASSPEEIRRLLDPVIAETERAARSIPEVKAIKNSRAAFAYNKHLYCIFVEFETLGACRT